MRLPRIKPRILILFALLVCAGGALSSDWVVFRLPEWAVSVMPVHIQRRLAEAGLLSSLSFDGPFLRDLAKNLDVEAADTVSVDGVSGDARRFQGKKNALVSTASTWSSIGDSYSFLLRIRFKKNSPESQEICIAPSKSAPIGFSLEDGILRFCLPVEGGSAVLENRMRNRSQWHSILVTSDPEARLVRLYDNGRLVASTNALPVAFPQVRLLIGNAQWHPLSADIDEFDVWNRPLDRREVKAASRLSFSASRHYAPLQDFALRAGRRAQYLLPAAVRVAERLREAAIFRPRRAGVPALGLRLSSGDRRRLSAAHETALRSGGRTGSGAKFRPCLFSTSRGRVWGRLCLDNPYIYHNCVRRPAYVAIADFDGDGEEEVIRLCPPGDFPLLHPGFLPEEAPPAMALVRLSVNGDDSGLYCIDLFQRNGEAWELDMAFFLPGSPLRKPPRRVFSACDLLPEGERLRRRDEVLDLILSDPGEEWSRREWAIARQEQTYAAARRGLPPVTPTAMNALGANRAPFLVTTNLDLAIPAFANVRHWESSRPDVISPDGTVRRPEGDIPVRATLTGHGSGGGDVATLEFRVMPERPRLPVLMLYPAIPPTKNRRSDFMAVYIPAGGGSPRRLSGFAGDGAGIKPRGNTSYVKGLKKPYSLKFGEPHGIFGPRGDRGLYLLGGYSDDTRLRSRLSYDLFRSFQTPGAPCVAPDVSWIEVFVNGDYYGVFEMCTRVRAPLFAEEPSVPELFKIKLTTPVFNEVSAYAFAQEHPSIEDASRSDSIVRLMEPIVRGGEGDFLRGIDRNMYVANIVDFHLLVNFTDNEDGRVTNFILAHETSGEGRYYFIPWDYDKTFLEEMEPQFLSHSLFDRLYKADAQFARSVGDRWRKLRGGPLSDAALFARIDADAAFLGPYMPFEYELLGKTGVQYGEQVRILRDMVRRNLDYMDRWAEALRGGKDAE